MSQQFAVELDNHPEALARLLETLAARHVDLRSVAVNGIGRRTTALFITNDDATTTEVLRSQHYRFCASEVVITSLPDQPGALAHLMREISQAHIEVGGLSLLQWHQGKAELAFSTDDPTSLRRLLGSHHNERVAISVG